MLHQRPYRDSSQLLECMTATHGRMGLVARGSRRAGYAAAGAVAAVRAAQAVVDPARRARPADARRSGRAELRARRAALALGLLLERAAAAVARPGRSESAKFFPAIVAASRSSAARRAWLARCACSSSTCSARSATASSSTASRRPASRCARNYATSTSSSKGFAAPSIAESDAELYPGRDLIALRDLTLDDEASLRTAQRLLGRVLRAHLGERPLQSRLVLQDIVSRGL